MPWTRHGYWYGPGTPDKATQPRLVSRCGGPGICKECAVQAARPPKADPSHPLLVHARHELELTKEDPGIRDAILQVIEVFAGHEQTLGSSVAAMAAEYVHQLLRHKPLSPLTDDPVEWARRENTDGFVVWQSLRDHEAFSDDGGKTYWLLSDGPGMTNDEGGVDRIIYPVASKDDVVRPPTIAQTYKLEEKE